MAETDACLHCHLVAEMKRWADEHLPKDSDGRPIAGGGELAGPLVNVLCDAVVLETAEGTDRMTLTNQVSITFATRMSGRLMFEPEHNPYSRAGRQIAIPAGAATH